MPKARYNHVFRRRREGKTDYRKRKGIILGKTLFVSVHISGKYIYSQVLKPSATGDLTIAAASSRDLVKKFGWKGFDKESPWSLSNRLLSWPTGRREESQGSYRVFRSG